MQGQDLTTTILIKKNLMTSSSLEIGRCRRNVVQGQSPGKISLVTSSRLFEIVGNALLNFNAVGRDLCQVVAFAAMVSKLS